MALQIVPSPPQRESNTSQILGFINTITENIEKTKIKREN